MWQAAVIIFDIIVFMLCLIGLGTIIFFAFTLWAKAEMDKGPDNTERDIDGEIYGTNPYKEEIFRQQKKGLPPTGHPLKSTTTFDAQK